MYDFSSHRTSVNFKMSQYVGSLTNARTDNESCYIICTQKKNLHQAVYLQDRDNISLLESALRRHFEIKSLYLTVLQQMPRFTFVFKKKLKHQSHHPESAFFFPFQNARPKKKNIPNQINTINFSQSRVKRCPEWHIILR